MKTPWTNRWLWAGTMLSCMAAACAPPVTTGDAGDSGGGDVISDIAADRAADGPVTGDVADVPIAPDVVDVPITTDVVDVAPPDDVVDVPIAIDVVDVAPPDDVPTALDVPTMLDATTDVTDSATGTDAVDVPASACAFPIAGDLAAPGTVSGTLSGASRIAVTSCQSNVGGAEAIYTLHIAASTGVTLSTGGSLDTVVSIRTACALSTSEVACNDDGGVGTLSVVRTTLAPGDYFVIVDQYGTAPTGGAFTLDYSTFTPAANATCATATPVTAGTPVTGDTNGGGAAATTCLTGSDGPQLFYSVTIPAGQRATITTTPTGTAVWTPVERVLADCAATTCLVSATATGASMPAVVTRDNAGTAPVTLIVAVSSTTAGESGTFSLDLALAPIPVMANATCSMATMISDGTSLTAQDASVAVDTLTSACRTTSLGRVLYYTASIPPLNTLTVTATPGAWNAVIRILDACGATACLASGDAATTGAAESLSYRNAGATARTVIIAVGSSSATTTGTFALTATIAPDPYAITTIPTACDDMTTATPLTGATTDDSTSPIAALPFAFDYFRSPVTHFSASSNGFVQLWPSATGTPSSSAGNAAIPSTATPNGYVAAFWDDLAPPSAGASDVRVLDVAAAPRHFTVQWTNWQFFLSTGSVLTFQAQFFETSNVIQFHYCTLTPASATDTRITGSSATIGLENLTGSTGVPFEYNTASSVTAATALVFTPVP